MLQADSFVNRGGMGRKGNGLASALGWFAVGLGTAQLLAPEAVARLIGVKPSRSTRRTMRVFGSREIFSGVGLLKGNSHPGWLWARVAGDVLDAALLGRTFVRRRSSASRYLGAHAGGAALRAGLSLAGVLAVGALDAMALKRARQA